MLFCYLLDAQLFLRAHLVSHKEHILDIFHTRCSTTIVSGCTSQKTRVWLRSLTRIFVYVYVLSRAFLASVFGYGLYRVTHGNLTSFEWVVLRTAPKRNKLCQCVVSTRWCHSVHCKRVNDHCSKHVSRAPHFLFWRRAVAPSLSRSFDVWFFFFGGIWNRVFTLTNPVRWMIWRKPSVRKFVRPIVSCWPVSWTI